jgi:hypothetical protein
MCARLARFGPRSRPFLGERPEATQQITVSPSFFPPHAALCAACDLCFACDVDVSSLKYQQAPPISLCPKRCSPQPLPPDWSRLLRVGTHLFFRTAKVSALACPPPSSHPLLSYWRGATTPPSCDHKNPPHSIPCTCCKLARLRSLHQLLSSPTNSFAPAPASSVVWQRSVYPHPSPVSPLPPCTPSRPRPAHLPRRSPTLPLPCHQQLPP